MTEHPAQDFIAGEGVVRGGPLEDSLSPATVSVLGKHYPCSASDKEAGVTPWCAG